MKYSIKKIYHGSESRNTFDSIGLSIDAAVEMMEINEQLWKKHGGVIVSKTEHTLIVEEANGEGRITFEIVEQDED